MLRKMYRSTLRTAILISCPLLFMGNSLPAARSSLTGAEKSRLVRLGSGVATFPSAHAPQSSIPRARSVIEPTAYVSLDPVPRGRAFDLALVLKIRPGFHVNAHKTSEDFLIPTEITADLPPGFRTVAINYPKGAVRKFQFSQQKLNVYEGSVTVRMKLEALDAAPVGIEKVPLKLRYQACTNEICLPPVSVPVVVAFQVADRGAKSRPVHPEIFSGVPDFNSEPSAKPRATRARPSSAPAHREPN